MQFSIEIVEPIPTVDTTIGAGATIILNKASRPLINLLRYYFLTQPESIAGSRAALTYLFSSDGNPKDPESKLIDAFIKTYATQARSKDDLDTIASSPSA